MFMTQGFAAFLIASNFLVGAVLGLAVAKLAWSSRFTVGLALRAAIFGGIAFLLASGLAGWAYEHAHRGQ
jgi:hypothetical protein